MSSSIIYFNVRQVICWRSSRDNVFLGQLVLRSKSSLVDMDRNELLLHNGAEMYPRDRRPGTDRVEKDVLVTTFDQRVSFCTTRIRETECKRHLVNFLAEKITRPCPQGIFILRLQAEH